MNCQKRYCGCKEYKKKEDFRRAKMQYPSIESHLEKWECNDEFQKGCKDFQAPPPRMTPAEFNFISNELLSELPEEFRSYASREAWDSGHSAGLEEVIGLLRGIVNGLKKPIEMFEAKIMKDN